MDGSLLMLGATGLLAGCGLVESALHRRNLRRIPIRVHVNGTRGKSSVTRLIAAGLREGGLVTCAKTTGTLARFILPDGSEYPVFRPGRANVIEQVRIVRAAVASGAEALVIECMALHPQLQSLCELKLVRATHGVITNARADHLDVMGPTPRDVALALAGTTPKGATLYTAERQLLEPLQQAAADRGSKLAAVDSSDVAAVKPADLDGFSYLEHAENVALALRVCGDIGVDRATALRGMQRATPDPGALSSRTVGLDNGGQLTFINAFAANDPESTGAAWETALVKNPQARKRIALINCRADRTDRSRQLADAAIQWSRADHYLVIGGGTSVFAQRAAALGIERADLTVLDGVPTPRIISGIERLAAGGGLVVGMGNIGGPGMELVDYFNKRGHSLRNSLQKAA